ncbi:unnamed protein product [Brachionus calyciflorus]|uniref:SHSP domain-containing protein n=1 Tax=Brachionus calyciflorus TaxID=104777 RepID=A0A813M2H1_9BILA|nr:unnamed protein product [Brachionus calyciflorus]
MSLIPNPFQRSAFDIDLWSSLDSLDLDFFDPFDELDRRMMARNFRWLNDPFNLRDHFPLSRPRVPEKYRIRVDCKGFSSDSVKISFSDDKKKIIVYAKEGEKNSKDEDYSLKEFKKTYDLPPKAETSKMISFFTPNGQLVVEIPIKVDEPRVKFNNEDHFPQVIDTENGAKQVQMNFPVPTSIDPSKIKVTCTDRDVIIQAEDRQERSDGFFKTSYYTRTTLPENTKIDTLNCTLENNKLFLKAALDPNFKSSYRTIPVETSPRYTSIRN